MEHAMTAVAQQDPKATKAAAWQIDPSHTDVEFAIRHLMVSNVKGHFGNVTGTVEIDPDNLTRPRITASIPVATIDTRSEQRDTHLRSGDFFAVDAYPTIEFEGGSITGDPMGDFKLAGRITIKGVTRDITLDVTTEGRGQDPWGNDRIGYSATAKLDRKDFGLTWNQILEAGGVAVGDTVKITINTELLRPRQ
jgi:polyisoprenoid-binding protein YceI